MAELIADEIYKIDIPLPNNPLKTSTVILYAAGSEASD